MTDSLYPTPPEHPAPPYDNSLGSSFFMHQPKPLAGVGTAAAVLIGVATLLSAVDTWSDWHRYHVVNDYVSGVGLLTDDDLRRADDISVLTGVLAFAGLVGAGVVFMVWQWRARQNAENLSVARHRRARGWVIGGWICPVVNFWFPFMIMNDIYRASRPDTPRDLAELHTVRGSAALGWWWALWVGMLVTDRIAIVNLRGDVTVESFHTYAIMSSIGLVALAGAAVLIVRIMREITAWQAPRYS
jgi:hypothetical protein